jgi:hypothetical protein
MLTNGASESSFREVCGCGCVEESRLWPLPEKEDPELCFRKALSNALNLSTLAE